MATQIKSIPIGGLTNSPSEFLSEDGDLAVAINMHHDDGGVVSTAQTAPKVLMQLQENESVVFIHENGSSFIHNIIERDGHYFYGDKEFVELEGENIKNNLITSIGNTLIFYSDRKSFYYIWMPDADLENHNYVYIDNAFPNLNIIFGLVCESPDGRRYSGGISHAKTEKDYPASASSGFKFDAVDRKTITDAVYAALNEDISYNWKNSMFIQPFVVRAAIRMYDEQLVCHTPLSLMVPSNRCPLVSRQTNPDATRDDRTTDFVFSSKSISSHLCCWSTNSNLRNELRNMRDLIKSIDIFVSKPIYTYETDETIDEIAYETKENVINAFVPDGGRGGEGHFTALGDDVSIGRWIKGSRNVEVYEFARRKLTDVLGGAQEKDSYVIVPVKKAEILEEEIRNESVLRLYRSYSVEEFCDLVESQNVLEHYVELKKKTSIDTFDQSEQMSDYFVSASELVPSATRVYNGRLNLGCVDRQLKDGFDLKQFLPYQTANRSLDSSSTITNVFKMKITYALESGIYSAISSNATLPNDASFDYIYINGAGVSKIEVFNLTNGTIATIYPKQSALLNGCVCFSKFKDLQFISGQINEETNNGPIPEPNTVYTSEVNNPFVFKAVNVTSVGNGRVIALVPQAIALSQGQFGQYPMTCFTTDGIWALSVSDTGGWLAKQPFSRDVVLNEDAVNILQLDRQIMFSTNRGLMLLSGSNVECISDMINSQQIQCVEGKTMSDLFTLMGGMISREEISDIDNGSFVNPNFKEFIGNAVFLYDYTHQRIIVGNPDIKFAYVYNMNDKAWTSIPATILSSVNSYPECYAMKKNHGIIRRLVNLPSIVAEFSVDSATVPAVSPAGSGRYTLKFSVSGMSYSEFVSKYGEFYVRQGSNEPQSVYMPYTTDGDINIPETYTAYYTDGNGSTRKLVATPVNEVEPNIVFSQEPLSGSKFSDLMYTKQRVEGGYNVKFYEDGIEFVSKGQGIIGSYRKDLIDTLSPGTMYYNDGSTTAIRYNEWFFIPDGSVFYFIYANHNVSTQNNGESNITKVDTTPITRSYLKREDQSHMEYEKVECDYHQLVDFTRSGEEAYITDEDAAAEKASAVSYPLDGFILTRPIKLGDPVARKTIRTINVQGKFQRDHVDIILLGCSDNNMFNWFIISSCKGSRLPFRYGTPFKYFRVALVTHLKPMESVSSITIEYETKELNKLRQ